MKPLTDIVKEYLDKIGADGLRCEECQTGCTKENLFLEEVSANVCADIRDAVPGYFVKCKECKDKQCDIRDNEDFIFIDKGGDCGCIKRTKPRAKKDK